MRRNNKTQINFNYSWKLDPFMVINIDKIVWLMRKKNSGFWEEFLSLYPAV